jgi:hypothetical protein
MAVSVPVFVQPLAADHQNVAKVVIVDITLDSDYADGGEAFNPAQLGLAEVWFATIEQKLPSAADVGTYVFQWDYDANKILVFWVDTSTDGAVLAEVPSGGTPDLSGVVVRARFEGLSS